MRNITLTLAAALGAATIAAAAPAPRPESDPAAVALLKQAHDNRSTFSAGFSGLRADLTVNDNGTELKGTMTCSAAGKVEINLPGASKDQEQWAHEQLGSAIGHRRADDFARGDGNNAITFGADDHSPLGRLVLLNDQFKSTYRVRDGHIAEVTRSMGAMKFTITVLSTRMVDGGKDLPSQFIVTYFDPAGAITKVDAYSDRYANLEGNRVPSARRVITAEHGSFTARSFALDNIKAGTAAAVSVK